SYTRILSPDYNERRISRTKTSVQRERFGWTYLLDGTADLREHIACVCTDQADGARHNDKHDGQHDGILGYVLPALV
ncbi:MAG: hypothetical protein WBW77_01925, partial [Candidatus Sulfotelmatobacter sp.]